MSTLQNRQQKSLFGAQMAFLIYWRSFRGIWELGIFEENLRYGRLAAFRVKLDIHHEKEGTFSLN